MYWPEFFTVTDPATSKKTAIYALTPDEFVQECQKRGKYLYVSHGICTECPYHGEYPFVSLDLYRTCESEALDLLRFPECIKGAVARFRRDASVPGFLGCYGFYYFHATHNPYLDALTRAKLIAYLPTAKLPGLRESGLCLILPDWYV